MHVSYFSKKYISRYFLFLLVPKLFFKFVLKYKYKKVFNTELDIDFPLKLSEKLQWMKLYDNVDNKLIYTDKLLVKEYISKEITGLKYEKVNKSKE